MIARHRYTRKGLFKKNGTLNPAIFVYVVFLQHGRVNVCCIFQLKTKLYERSVLGARKAISRAKFEDPDYFPGICWNRIRQNENGIFCVRSKNA